MLFPAKAFLSTLLSVVSTTVKSWNGSVPLAPGQFAREPSTLGRIDYQHVAPAILLRRDIQQFLRRQNARHGQFHPNALYSQDQVFAIQIVACTLAGLSLVSALLTFYWFLKMKKKFRHQSV